MAVEVPGDGEVVEAHLGVASARVSRAGEVVSVSYVRDGREHLVVTLSLDDPLLHSELGRLSEGPPPPPRPRRRPARRRGR